MHHRLFLLASVAALLCVPGCAQHRSHTVRLVDGTDYTIDVVDGKPVTSANECAVNIDTSFAVEIEGGLIYWQYELRPRVPLSQIVVSEVFAYGAEKTLLVDSSPRVVDGVWKGRTPGLPADSDTYDWLADENDDLLVFRFALTDPEGHACLMHQAVHYPGWLGPAMLESLPKLRKP